MFAVGGGAVHQVHQQRALDEQHVHVHGVVIGGVGVDLHIADAAALFHVEEGVGVLAGGTQFHIAAHLGVEQGDVRVGLLMLTDHGLKVHVEDHVAVGEQGKALLGAAQIIEVGAQRVQNAEVFAAGLLRDEGGQEEQAVVAGVQIPLLAGAEVVHQGAIVALHDDAHVAHAGIDHAGKDEVHHAIAARERQRRHRALVGQFPQGQIVLVGIDDAHHVLHFASASLLATSCASTCSPAPTLKPAGSAVS